MNLLYCLYLFLLFIIQMILKMTIEPVLTNEK